MNLSRMRDIDAADPIGTLGPRVTPAPTPAPAPVRRGDGFIVGTDGKLSTDLPDPTVTHEPPAPAPTVYEFADALYESMRPPAGPVCAREPLKVRILDTYPWPEMRGLTVRAEPCKGGALRPTDGEPGHGKFIFPLFTESHDWERVK